MWSLEQRVQVPEPGMALQLVRTGKSLDHIADFRHLMLRVLLEVVEPLLTFPSQTFVRWRFTRLPFAAEAGLLTSNSRQRAFHQTAQLFQMQGKAKVDAAAEIRKVKLMSRNGGQTSAVQQALAKFLGSGLTPRLVFDMLKTLRYDADTAYFLFKWAGEQAGYEHESRHYDFIVQVLAAANQFEEIDAVLVEMLSKERQLGFEASLALVVSYANAGLIDKALAIFYQLRSRGDVMPAHMYNCIFNALDKLHLHQQAVQLVEDLMATGFSPRESTSDILLRMFCRGGSVDRAVWFLRTLSQRGWQVNPMALSMVLDNLCRVGKENTAVSLYEEAVLTSLVAIADTGFVFGALVCGVFRTGKLDRVSFIIRKLMHGGLIRQLTGFPFQDGGKPYSFSEIANIFKEMGFISTFAYNCLIEGLCSASKLEEAQQVLNEMQLGKVPADAFTYSSIIDAICKAGKLEEAEKLLESLEASECKPDVVTYTNMIIGFCRACRFEHAFMTLQRMKGAGCSPNVVTYNAIVNGLCKALQFTEALKLVTDMVEAGCEPDEVTYSTIIDAFCKKEDWLLALDVFDRMRHRNCRGSVDLYGRLAHCLCKAGQVQAASSLLQDMLNGEPTSPLVLGGKPCRPNLIVYNTVINGLCENDQLDEALVVLRVMQDEGFHPDTITYTSFILAYCKAKKIDEALAIQELMVSAGCTPDAVTYNTLFLGLRFVGRVEEACALLQEMLNTGCQPDIFTFKIHIETLCKRRMLDAAVVLLEVMKATKLAPDMGIFKSLIYAHYELGRANEARQILQQEAKAFSERNPGMSLASELHEASNPYEQKLLETILRNGV